MDTDTISKMKDGVLKELLCLQDFKFLAIKKNMLLEYGSHMKTMCHLANQQKRSKKKLFAEYKNDLLIDGEILHDPLHIQDGLVNEEDRASLWPTMLY